MTDTYSDQVNHPIHYGGEHAIYETIKVLEAWLTTDQFIGFCRGNAIKYLARAGKKNQEHEGAGEEDLKKADFYTKYEADYIERLKNGMVGEARAIYKIIEKHNKRFDPEDPLNKLREGRL